MMRSRVAKVRGKSLRPRDVIDKWKIIKGDTVQMMRGPDAGKQGKVLRVLRKKNKVVVEGINITKRHNRHGAGGTYTSGYWYAESPVHYATVALLHPDTKKPVKSGFAFQDGEKVRVVRGTGVVIPKPEPEINLDKRKSVGPKDTPPDIALLRTFDIDTLNPLLKASEEHKARVWAGTDEEEQ